MNRERHRGGHTERERQRDRERERGGQRERLIDSLLHKDKDLCAQWFVFTSVRDTADCDTN